MMVAIVILSILVAIMAIVLLFLCPQARSHAAARDRLKAREREYRLLFDEMSAGMALHEIICDSSGTPCDYRFLEINPAFERLTGLGANDIRGKRVLEVLPKIERYWIDTYGKVALGGGHVQFEHYSDELKRHYTVTAYSPEQGKFVTLFSDVTALKQAEAARRRLESQVHHAQKLESLGVLAGGIAHDFNNLLMGILGNANLATAGLPATSVAREHLHEIESTAQRAAELCKQMLAYSGKGKFVVQALDLRDLVEEMSHMLKVAISKTVLLKYDFAEGVPPVEGDATQFRQVVMNLIMNASEAIGDKSGVVSISIGRMDCDEDYLQTSYVGENLAPGTYVSVEVSDTGSGMGAEALDRIFEPFYTTKTKGRGLGLAAVMGIVRGHKGSLKVYSERGKGTTFKILLPAVSGPKGARLPTIDADATWEGEGTVLLVDDEETVIRVGRRMLERLGFKVLVARNGQEAVECFREHGTDMRCVIMDLTMPVMSGEDAFREIRRIRKDVPIILSSGYNEQHVIQRFVGRDLTGFIQKPYQLVALSATLRGILEA